MKEDLSTKIEDWLKTQGYTLEMYTAKAFQKANFKVAQSVHYLDSETNQAREIDLVCYYSKVVNGVTFNLTFVIECKGGKDKPWLVFKSNGTSNVHQLRLGYIDGTGNGLRLIRKLTSKRSKHNESITFFTQPSAPLGHGVTQAFTSGHDSTYSATMTSLKAIKYFIDKYRRNKAKVCSLYFPLIIIDNRLFDVMLLEDNAIQINEVKQSKFTQIRSDLDKTSLILLSTRDNLETLCDELRKSCDLFFKVFSKQIKEIAETSPYSDVDVD